MVRGWEWEQTRWTASPEIKICTKIGPSRVVFGLSSPSSPLHPDRHPIHISIGKRESAPLHKPIKSSLPRPHRKSFERGPEVKSELNHVSAVKRNNDTFLLFYPGYSIRVILLTESPKFAEERRAKMIEFSFNAFQVRNWSCAW